MKTVDLIRPTDGLGDHWRTRDFWGEALAWQGSASPRVLPRVAAFGLISAVIAHAAPPTLNIPVGPHEVAGVILGLLLVLRTNAGYDRWWEARKLWGGIVNQSRNLAIQALSYGPREPRWQDETVRWTIAFAHVCRHSLRGERELPELEALLGPAEAARVAGSAHPPSAVARAIGARLREAHDRGEMNGFAFLRAETERSTLIDHIGACERIVKTPLARVFSIKIRRFILLFLVTLTFALLSKFDTNWLVPPFVMLIAYTVLSVDLIGSELQNPFSRSHLGHLPLDDIARAIETNLLGLLAEERRGEYVSDPVPGAGEVGGVPDPDDGRVGRADPGHDGLPRPVEPTPGATPLRIDRVMKTPA